MMILTNKTKPRYYYFKDRYRISESQPPELIAKFNRGINCSSFKALYGHIAYNGLEIVNNLNMEQKKGIKSVMSSRQYLSTIKKTLTFLSILFS